MKNFDRESDKKISESLRELQTSTLSDAIEKVTGVRGAMNSRIRPIVGAGLVGRAVTVLNRRITQMKPPLALFDAIDRCAEGSVLVLAFDEPGEEASGWGGLLTEAAISRRVAGTVVDAAVRDTREIQERYKRDTREIQEKKYPVFGRSISPCSGAGKYTSVDHGIGLTCGGVTVIPGDWLVGDSDGVVVIPSMSVEDVLQEALSLEEREAEMRLEIRKLKAIGPVFSTSKRI